MNNSILQLFEGLTFDQAKELRRRIVPALEMVRREVITEASKPATKTTHARAQRTSPAITSRGNNAKMQSQNNSG
jgi:hypothetical protein